ncbi:MAG: hypothetical protein ACKO19_02305, partial [Betaproteobacteria bacterium]
MPSSSNLDKHLARFADQATIGDSVYLISPAGAIDEQAPFDLALHQLSKQGWTACPDPGVRACWQRFA